MDEFERFRKLSNQAQEGWEMKSWSIVEVSGWNTPAQIPQRSILNELANVSTHRGKKFFEKTFSFISKKCNIFPKMQYF